MRKTSVNAVGLVVYNLSTNTGVYPHVFLPRAVWVQILKLYQTYTVSPHSFMHSILGILTGYRYGL